MGDSILLAFSCEFKFKGLRAIQSSETPILSLLKLSLQVVLLGSSSYWRLALFFLCQLNNPLTTTTHWRKNGVFNTRRGYKLQHLGTQNVQKKSIPSENNWIP